MPNPKRRHSHQRTAKRRTNYGTEMPEVSVARQVGSDFGVHLRHHATPDGYYKGRKLPGYK
ncbi:MAG: 50S ribosomal protein L32 [Chthonomonas sp.]|nr:50S ribosomal protein L32 [Chthonomonas sp.]